MSAPAAASVVESVTPPSSVSAVALWRTASRERRVGVVVLIALGLWSLYKCLTRTPEDKHDDAENSIASDAAADLREAAARYGKDYQDRMKATTAVPNEKSMARPFIGFSLADNIVKGSLVVDGVFVGGPADQTGIDIDHELLAINSVAVTTIEEVRQAVAAHCRPGQVTRMRLRKEDGVADYEVLLWVMTTEDRFRGKPYYFDTAAHKVRQSGRMKQTWTPATSPKK